MSGELELVWASGAHVAGPAQVCEVVVMGPPGDWAAALVAGLVGARLVAAGHVSSPVRSLYRWQGVVHDEVEVRLTFHTRVSLVGAVADAVVVAHPYEVACVLAVPVLAVSGPFAAWVYENTLDEPPA